MQQAKNGPVVADQEALARQAGTTAESARLKNEEQYSFSRDQKASKQAATRTDKRAALTQTIKPVYDSGSTQINRVASANLPERDFYTIQLLGSRDKFGLELYLTNSGFRDKAFIVGEQKDGAPWYIALFGRYESKDAAQAAISSLPKHLRDHSPWIRLRSEINYAENKAVGSANDASDPQEDSGRIRFKPVLKQWAANKAKVKTMPPVEKTLPPPVKLESTHEDSTFEERDRLAKQAIEDNTLGTVMEIDAS